MNASAEARLTTFNSLALRFQDEAFTLAYYLAGDETSAAEATQAAFASLYRRLGGRGSRQDQFRLEALHGIWVHIKKVGASMPPAAARKSGAYPPVADLDDLGRLLLGLKEDERLAIILVDVLNLDYEETAQVMDCPKKQVNRLLAQGRVKMAAQKAAIQ